MSDNTLFEKLARLMLYKSESQIMGDTMNKEQEFWDWIQWTIDGVEGATKLSQIRLFPWDLRERAAKAGILSGSNAIEWGLAASQDGKDKKAWDTMLRKIKRMAKKSDLVLNNDGYFRGR